jgi:hypothetical protein
MKRHLSWILLLVALVVITACRPAAEVDEVTTEAPAATDELGACQPGGDDCEDEETEAATDATAVPTAQPTTEKEAAEPASAEPVGDPFAIRDTDWVMGAEDPVVTLIEYSDYF